MLNLVPVPRPLAVWQDGPPLGCGVRPCGVDGAPPGPRRRPEGQRLGTRTTRSLMTWGKGERGSGCSAARGPVMRGAQARMSRPRKPCARHDAQNHIYLEK